MTSKIYVLPFNSSFIPDNCIVINTTTRSENWSRELSPMLVGTIFSNNGISRNMENFWQYAKVYSNHVDSNQNPNEEYFKWKEIGYNKKWADRYPAGKGAIPLYTWYCGRKLNYIEARKNIYLPYYEKNVKKTEAFSKLETIWNDCLKQNKNLVLNDFDAYNHRDLGYSWDNILNDSTRKMGHAFILAKMLSKK